MISFAASAALLANTVSALPQFALNNVFGQDPNYWQAPGPGDGKRNPVRLEVPKTKPICSQITLPGNQHLSKPWVHKS